MQNGENGFKRLKKVFFKNLNDLKSVKNKEKQWQTVTNGGKRWKIVKTVKNRKKKKRENG